MFNIPVFKLPQPTPWKTWSSRRLMLTLHIVDALALLFEGYDQGVMAGVNESPDYIRLMNLGPGIIGNLVSPNNVIKQGGIVAIYYLGSIVGGLWGGGLSDKYGRIFGIMFGVFWSVLGGALQAGAMNINWMLCARLITGIGTGFLNCIIPSYTAETSEAKSRGGAISTVFLANYTGITIAYWLAFGVSFPDPEGAFRWRFPLAFQCVPGILLGMSIMFMPESPRYLIKVGRDEEALEILARLRANGDVNHPDVKLEYAEIIEVIEEERKMSLTNAPWRMILGLGTKGRHFARRANLAMWLQILAQLGTGISATTVYSPVLFGQAGYGDVKARWLASLNNTVGIIGSIMNIITIDRLGRRKLLMGGAALLGVFMFLTGGFSQATAMHPDKSAQYGAASAAFIFLFTLTYSCTWCLCPFIYAAEIWPSSVRGQGNAFGVVGWSLGLGAGTLSVPKMLESLDYNAFYVFGALNIAWVPVVYLFFPETAQRSLESIEILFSTKSPLNFHEERAYQAAIRSNPGLDTAELSGLSRMEDPEMAAKQTKHQEYARGGHGAGEGEAEDKRREWAHEEGSQGRGQRRVEMSGASTAVPSAAHSSDGESFGEKRGL
ncbi:hypothetical protein YB2330_006524 [Saitoella coloradoensis]